MQLLVFLKVITQIHVVILCFEMFNGILDICEIQDGMSKRI